jgi:phosphoesterase RecJ-like protein
MMRVMKIDDYLKNVKTVGITGHIRPDGDSIGSCLGLYNYIKDNAPSVEADIYLEEPGGEFSYLANFDKIKTEPGDTAYDVFFVLDCGDVDRILPFAKCFNAAAKTVCIDHHISNSGFADESVIEPHISSASELLYTLLSPEKVSKNVAECIYTGIIHDTGVFKYSCTSKQTMTIAGELMEKGIDYSNIIDNSFYSKTYIQNQILGRALLESIMFYDGKCVFSAVTREIMKFYNITGRDLGGIVEQLRLTDGVEVAIFMYETDDNEFKVSMRSKNVIDVAKIAMEYGGGGHVRAAGFTGKGDIHTIINSIGEKIEEQYKQIES